MEDELKSTTGHNMEFINNTDIIQSDTEAEERSESQNLNGYDTLRSNFSHNEMKNDSKNQEKNGTLLTEVESLDENEQIIGNKTVRSKIVGENTARTDSSENGNAHFQKVGNESETVGTETASSQTVGNESERSVSSFTSKTTNKQQQNDTSDVTQRKHSNAGIFPKLQKDHAKDNDTDDNEIFNRMSATTDGKMHQSNHTYPLKNVGNETTRSETVGDETASSQTVVNESERSVSSFTSKTTNKQQNDTSDETQRKHSNAGIFPKLQKDHAKDNDSDDDGIFDRMSATTDGKSHQSGNKTVRSKTVGDHTARTDSSENGNANFHNVGKETARSETVGNETASSKTVGNESERSVSSFTVKTTNKQQNDTSDETQRKHSNAGILPKLQKNHAKDNDTDDDGIFDRMSATTDGKSHQSQNTYPMKNSSKKPGNISETQRASKEKEYLSTGEARKKNRQPHSSTGTFLIKRTNGKTSGDDNFDDSVVSLPPLNPHNDITKVYVDEIEKLANQFPKRDKDFKQSFVYDLRPKYPQWYSPETKLSKREQKVFNEINGVYADSMKQDKRSLKNSRKMNERQKLIEKIKQKEQKERSKPVGDNTAKTDSSENGNPNFQNVGIETKTVGDETANSQTVGNESERSVNSFTPKTTIKQQNDTSDGTQRKHSNAGILPKLQKDHAKDNDTDDDEIFDRMSATTDGKSHQSHNTYPMKNSSKKPGNISETQRASKEKEYLSTGEARKKNRQPRPSTGTFLTKRTNGKTSGDNNFDESVDSLSPLNSHNDITKVYVDEIEKLANQFPKRDKDFKLEFVYDLRPKYPQWYSPETKLSKHEQKVFNEINGVYADDVKQDKRSLDNSRKMDERQKLIEKIKQKEQKERRHKKLENAMTQYEQLSEVRDRFEILSWYRNKTQYITTRTLEHEKLSRHVYGLPESLDKSGQDIKNLKRKNRRRYKSSNKIKNH